MTRVLRFRWTSHRAALALALLVSACLAGPTAGAASAAAGVTPAPGSIVRSSPAEVRVTLPATAPAGSELQVLDPAGVNRDVGGTTVQGATLTAQLPVLGAATYTVLWEAGSNAGASTFTVWKGGALPARAARAQQGGPGPHPTPLVEGLLLGLGLAESAVAIGGLPYGRRRSLGAQRAAGLLLAGAATGAALLHTAAVAGGLDKGQLTWAVLISGIPLAALAAASLGLLGAICARAPALSGGLSAAAAVALLAAIPAARAGGVPTIAAALTSFLGWAMFAGAWPHAWRASNEPAPAIRWLGLALAVAAGIPLWLLWRPLAGWTAGMAGAGAAVALFAGRPGRRHGVGPLLATVIGIVPLVLLAPALGGPVPGAGRPRLVPTTAVPRQGGAADVHLLLADPTPGTHVLGVDAPGSHGAGLTVHLQSLEYPQLQANARLVRIRPGVYATQTGALSVPGPWTAAVAGATFAFTLNRPPLPETCPQGFTALATAEATLSGPVRALTTAADDGNVALAATATEIFSTSDGGRQWLPGGKLAGVTAIALGQHGEWFAATPNGVERSRDGGRQWVATAVHSQASALDVPLYPAGLGIWALAAGRVYHRLFRVLFDAPRPGWVVVGSAPSGVTAMVAFPGTSDTYGGTGLLVAGAQGLSWSADGGQRWVTVSDPPGPVTSLAAGPSGVWAGGPTGVSFAPSPTGPWKAVQVGIGTDGATVAVAANGTVVVDLQNQGLFVRLPGHLTWRRIGCWPHALTAIAGTYHPGGPPQDTSVSALAYWGDREGDIVALLPAASAQG